MSFLITFAYAFIPFIATGVVFALITRYDLISAVARPVNARLFGKSKTWRGFLVTPILAGIFVLLWSRLDPFFPQSDFLYSEHNAFWLGFSLQLVFMLSELPNSYLKRRLGIAPGKRPASRAWLFALGDLLDAAPGVMVVLILWTDLAFLYVLENLLLAVALKLCVNYLLYLAGVRKEPL